MSAALHPVGGDATGFDLTPDRHPPSRVRGLGD
jgi:hypothetical protein